MEQCKHYQDCLDDPSRDKEMEDRCRECNDISERMLEMSLEPESSAPRAAPKDAPDLFFKGHPAYLVGNNGIEIFPTSEKIQATIYELEELVALLKKKHPKHLMNPTDDPELITVITDFLEQGFADSIAAMFRQDPTCYGLVDQLLTDERYMVRMGTAVLFEELAETRPREVELAIPTLLPLLDHETAWVRGEAVNLLGIIGTAEALAQMHSLRRDPDPQVREIVEDFLETAQGQ